MVTDKEYQDMLNRITALEAVATQHTSFIKQIIESLKNLKVRVKDIEDVGSAVETIGNQLFKKK